MAETSYKKLTDIRKKVSDVLGVEVSNIVDLHTFPSDILERRAWRIALPKIKNYDDTETPAPTTEHVLSIGDLPHRRIGSTKYSLGWRQVPVPDRVDFPSLTLKFAENKRAEVAEYYQRWSESIVSVDGVYSYLSESLLPIVVLMLSPNQISAPSNTSKSSSLSPIRGYVINVFPESFNNFTLDSESGLILPSISFSVFMVSSFNAFENKATNKPAPATSGSRILTRRTI